AGGSRRGAGAGARPVRSAVDPRRTGNDRDDPLDDQPRHLGGGTGPAKPVPGDVPGRRGDRRPYRRPQQDPTGRRGQGGVPRDHDCPPAHALCRRAARVCRRSPAQVLSRARLRVRLLRILPPPHPTREYLRRPGMSARFLVTCWPFEGHVFPQVSIAMALRERGHEVAFYTGEAARPTIEAAGFPVFGFRAVDEARVCSLIEALEKGASGSRPKVGLLRRTLRGWLVETIPDQVADLERVMASWGPGVLVSDLSMWGPIVVLWERDRIPVVLSSTFMGPLIPGPDAPPWGFGLAPAQWGLSGLRNRVLARVTDVAAGGLRRRVDVLRAEQELPPLGESVNAFTGWLPLYLVGNVPELDYERGDLPGSVHY